MKQYEVNITDEAASDMKHIFEYVSAAAASSAMAEKLYVRLAYAIRRLNQFPERCPVIRRIRNIEVRGLVEDNYLICYIVREDTVTVVGVLYGASDIIERIGKRI